MRGRGYAGTLFSGRFRAVASAFAVALAAALASSAFLPGSALAQAIGEPDSYRRIVESASGPVLEPGDDGPLRLTLRNPSLAASMVNVTLRLSIYLYRSLESELPVATMSHPPVFVNSAVRSHDIDLPAFDLAPNATRSVELTVDTSASTPHPGYFDQGAYFVRMWLAFGHEGANYTMFSRGYFTDEQWRSYREAANASVQSSLEYLASIGCDGVLPDTGFTVRLRLPMWPLAALSLATVGTAGLALMYHLDENPGKAPRLEKAFQRARGKAKQAWAFCKQPLRKP